MPAALCGYAAVVTGIALGARGQAQFVFFHLSFASLEVYCLLRLLVLQRRSRDPGLRRRFRWAFGAYLSAVAVWFTDLYACDFLTTGVLGYGLPRIEWHAVWHLGISAAFTVLLGVIADLRRELQRAALGPC